MYIYFSKPRENQCRITVLGIVDKEKRHIKLTVARCGLNDTFDPKIGLKLCQERMANKNYFAVKPYVEPITTLTEFIYVIENYDIERYLNEYHVKLT